MKLIENKIIDYVNAVDSTSPTPGGGSVAALCSALGSALIGMVGHLTLNKKKFLELDKSIQDSFNNNFKRIREIKSELLVLVDEDAINFNLLMDAYRLPKNTESEKLLREQEIERATIKAMDVPIKILDLSYEILTLINVFVDNGSKNVLSDAGVGSILAIAGVKAAILNIKINLISISNKELVNEVKMKCEKLLSESNSIACKVEIAMDECYKV